MAAWAIDASVAVKWFVREPLSDDANQLIFEPHDLCAPDLVLIEVVNAFRKHIRTGAIERGFAEASFAALPRILQ